MSKALSRSFSPISSPPYSSWQTFSQLHSHAQSQLLIKNSLPNCTDRLQKTTKVKHRLQSLDIDYKSCTCTTKFTGRLQKTTKVAHRLQKTTKVRHRPTKFTGRLQKTTKFTNRLQKTTKVRHRLQSFTNRLQKTTKVGHRLQSFTDRLQKTTKVQNFIDTLDYSY